MVMIKIFTLSRFAELPVVPTSDNTISFGTCFQKVNYKIWDLLLNAMFVVLVARTDVSSDFLQ